MPLDFPSNPINGQTYDNYYWDASSNAWRSSGTKAGLQPRVTALELADATTNKSGLVPIQPTTATFVGGTGSVNSLGAVTFTNCTEVLLDGIFTGLYRNYKILVSSVSGSATVVGFRVRAGGSTFSSGNYQYSGARSDGTTGANNWAGGNDTMFYALRLASSQTTGALSAEIYAPQLAVNTNFQSISSSYFSGSYPESIRLGGFINNTNSYDGIGLISNSVISGVLQVFGYND